MPLNFIQVIELVDLNRHRGLAVIPTYNPTPVLPNLIDILIETLPDDFGILIVDDCSPRYNALIDEISAVIESSKKIINILKQESNLGFVKNVNTVFKNISGLDVILCNSDVVPARNWYPGLLAAAKSSYLVATATAVTNHGSIATVDIPESDSNYLETLDLLGSSAENEMKFFPILPTCVGHLVYFNSAALEAVGYFDEIFSPGYGEEVDWSQRAIAHGFRHVLAPESVVIHEGNFSFSEKFGADQVTLKKKNNDLILGRYPNLSNIVETICAKDRSSVQSSRLNFRRISRKLSLRIDLTFLRPLELETPATQLALKLSSRIFLLQHFETLEFIVSDDMNAHDIFAYLGPNANVIHSNQSYDLPRSDFVFRPCQIHTKRDLVRLNEMGKHQILCQLDFTSYENPYCFENLHQWIEYRSTIELAHELVDEFIYLSEFVREQSLLLGLARGNGHAGEVIASSAVILDKQILDAQGLTKNFGDTYNTNTENETITGVSSTSFNQNYTSKLDQLLDTLLEEFDSESWDKVAKKITKCIDELARIPSTATKDVLWELLARNYEKELRDENEKNHLLDLDRTAKAAIELHNIRFENSSLFRYRHSRLGIFIAPKGSYRDRVIQLLWRSPSDLSE